MYCCSWWTFFNLTESNTLKLQQAHFNHLIDNEVQSLLSLTIICMINKSPVFSKNVSFVICFFFKESFLTEISLIILKNTEDIPSHQNLPQITNKKTWVLHHSIPNPQRTGMYQYYTVLQMLLIYISEISIFQKGWKALSEEENKLVSRSIFSFKEVTY